ncbi:hypothetical protein Ancab_000300 [Ancistrocladus abbreviatus]
MEFHASKNNEIEQNAGEALTPGGGGETGGGEDHCYIRLVVFGLSVDKLNVITVQCNLSLSIIILRKAMSPFPHIIANFNHSEYVETHLCGSVVLEQLGKDADAIHLGINLDSGMGVVDAQIGDETFMIAALMAMRHPKSIVLSGALGALVVMTVPSTGLGRIVPNLISRKHTNAAATAGDAWSCSGGKRWDIQSAHH